MPGWRPLFPHNNNYLQSLLTSQPHGRAWKIHNKDQLIQEVVPRFFAQSKYESFSRQITGWGASLGVE